MKPPSLPGSLLLAASLACASGARASGPATLEELFQWGEYDSLIHLLEPHLLEPARSAAPGKPVIPATRADSAEEARARLYLGVAYWAKGRTEAGSSAFLQATRLDPDLRLDPLYATPEMAAHFERLAEVSQRLLQPPGPPAPSRDGRDPMPGKSLGASTWWKWGGAAGIAIAGTLTAVYFATRSPEPPRETTTIIDPGAMPPSLQPNSPP